MAFSETMEYAYFEGKFIPFKDANVSVGTHALHYGTGAFAGIRGYLDQDGETINIFRLREHAARLLRSAKLLRMELPHDVDSVVETVLELTRRNAPVGDVYYRPLVYKSSVQLTPRLKGIDDELAIYMMPMGDYLDTQRGQKVIVSSWTRITDNIIPARGKITGGYINSSLAKDEAEEKGADEAIMLDVNGKVAEGTGCNLFIVRDGVLTTAPITGDILEGITRRSILQVAADLGIPTEQRSIDRSELYLADEAFFCGTGVQVAWIDTIDGRTIGTGAQPEMVEQIRQILFDTFRGKSDRYADWITPLKLKQPVAAR
ncbi:MAG: branched-chain amino acid transaminase [Chloroflexota bacterium]|nr:branched-chain amino acid transaminase [Chloroflexota bacterium]